MDIETKQNFESIMKKEEGKLNNFINSSTAINNQENDISTINNKENEQKIQMKEKPKEVIIEIKKKKKKKKEKEIIDKIKIKKLNDYPTSIYPYFFISFGLFYLSCNAAWNEYGSSSLSIPFLIIGIIQYILGIIDFYQGNNFLFILNIIIGLRYLNFFLNYFEINGLKRTNKIFSNVQGMIDFILFAFFAVFSILMKEEGIFNIINYFFLTLTTGFFVLSGFSESYTAIIKIAGYFLFINSISFLFTGIVLVIHDTFRKPLIKFVEPRIK